MKVMGNTAARIQLNHGPRNDSGFTIVELIISIIIAGVLLTSINAVYTSQVYLSERVRDTTLANAYVEGKAEALRSAGYLNLTNGTIDITSELPNELSRRSGNVTISSHTTAVKRVAITVNYDEQGTSRTFTYTTLLGELGVGQQ